MSNWGRILEVSLYGFGWAYERVDSWRYCSFYYRCEIVYSTSHFKKKMYIDASKVGKCMKELWILNLITTLNVPPLVTRTLSEPLCLKLVSDDDRMTVKEHEVGAYLKMFRSFLMYVNSIFM